MSKKKDAIQKLIDRKLAERGARYFTKRDLAYDVLKELDPLPSKKGINIREIVRKHIESVLGDRLKQKDEHGIPIYENYRDHEGNYRWQKLKYMYASDLRVMIQSREQQLRGHERAVERYTILLAMLDRAERATGHSVRVGEVYDEAVAAMSD